jgi:REP element-mobilizing transposase RayT
MEKNLEPKGWYSRGYLPHLDTPGLLQSITFRLADSLPKAVTERLSADTEPGDVERRRLIEQYLDAGYGACRLGRPEIARIVEDTLLHFDSKRYRLLAWVVMPSHVHVLIETLNGFPLAKVVKSWKSFSAGQANRRLERSGRFWARDYFDRYIRDDRHFLAVKEYIENNPVKAGLVGRARDWTFGSAFRRGAG